MPENEKKKTKNIYFLIINYYSVITNTAALYDGKHTLVQTYNTFSPRLYTKIKFSYPQQRKP